MQPAPVFMFMASYADGPDLNRESPDKYPLLAAVFIANYEILLSNEWQNHVRVKKDLEIK